MKISRKPVNTLDWKHEKSNQTRVGLNEETAETMTTQQSYDSNKEYLDNIAFVLVPAKQLNSKSKIV